MTTGAPGGGGPGQVVIPGDPAELTRLAGIYARSAGGLSDAAGHLHASLGAAADWQGSGAQAHAVRAQALAGAHQVGRNALYLASQALATYAEELTQAQGLARQANAATATAQATGDALATLLAKEQTASTVSPDIPAEARFGNSPSPYQQDVIRSSQLQSTFDGEQSQAVNLGSRALALATAAASKAAAAFTEVAQMAGSPAARTSGDPWNAYLGVTQPGEAAALIEASALLSGTAALTAAPGDTQVLADLAADPGGGQNAKLASLYLKRDTLYSSDAGALLAWLRSHGLQGGLPPGFSTLPGPIQAELLAERVAADRVTHGSLTWLRLTSDGLHAGSFLLAGASVVLGFTALIQAGVDAPDDAATAGAAEASVTVEAEAGAAASKAALVRNLAKASTVLGVGGLGADGGGQYLTKTIDIPQLVFDGLAVAPGVGALLVGSKAATLATEQAVIEGQLASAGGESATQLAAKLAGLETSSINWDLLEGVLDVHAVNFGLAGWVYGTASLAAPSGG